MGDNQDLNPDAIYAAMVWLREYLGSRKGKAAYMELLRRRNAAIDEYELTGGNTLLSIPFIPLTKTMIESIYPGEAESVRIGIDLADSVWREPPDQIEMRKQHMKPDDPRVVALSRFIADRSN